MDKKVKVYIFEDDSKARYNFVKEYTIKELHDITDIVDIMRLVHYQLQYNFILDDELILLFEPF